MKFDLSKILEENVFFPSQDWLSLTKRPVLASTEAIEPSVYEEVLRDKSRFYGNIRKFYESDQELGTSTVMQNFDSLYLGPSGTIYLLQPHSHDSIAGQVIRQIHPNIIPPQKKTKGGGWTHSDLTQKSGIMRFQIYQNGMGITVDLSNPPNTTQLQIIHEIYNQTSQEVFVAEIAHNGKILERLESFMDLVRYINKFDIQGLTGA